MTGPAWLSAVVATVMLLIAAGSVVRLAVWRLRRQAAEPEADALHVLMGVAMAGMLQPQLSPVPAVAWRAVFTAAAAWFAWRAIARRRNDHARGWRPRPGSWRCAHPEPHCVECAAMIYMLLPAGGGSRGAAMAMPGMASAAPAANPALALVLAVFMLGYIVWTADRLASQSLTHSDPAAALAPRAAACSKIAMSLAMGYMLLTML